MAHRVSSLAAAMILATAAAAADPVAVEVSADTAGASTRIILTLERPAGFEARATEGGVAISFFDPIAADPRERTLADSLVTGWRAEGPRTFLLVTGPGYKRHDLFELKNPSRIVVDVQGDRAASARTAPARVVPRSQRIVVLDPGHGGVEQGAVGPTGLEEKTVALDLARRLAILLERDGTTVVLTRDDDRLVPLDDRTATANHNRAELFVSIHLNSARSSRAFGAETYFLSPDATDDEARTVAALENRAYAADEAPASPPAGDGLELILWDLAQNRYLAESARLAETVQNELNALAGTRNRGIRQAPFRVLMGATMPAILVEVGFLSNPEEEAKLRDSAHRDRIAEALARAIGTFRREDAKAGAAAAGSR